MPAWINIFTWVIYQGKKWLLHTAVLFLNGCDHWQKVKCHLKLSLLRKNCTSYNSMFLYYSLGLNIEIKVVKQAVKARPMVRKWFLKWSQHLNYLFWFGLLVVVVCLFVCLFVFPLDTGVIRDAMIHNFPFFE